MADVRNYLLINDEDPPMIETVCLWDGETPYKPPVDTWRLEEQTDPATQVSGARYIDGAWVPPAPPEEP